MKKSLLLNVMTLFAVTGAQAASWVIADNGGPTVVGDNASGSMDKGQCYDISINQSQANLATLLQNTAQASSTYSLNVKPSEVWCGNKKQVAWIYAINNNTQGTLYVKYYDATETANNRIFQIAANSSADLGSEGTVRGSYIGALVPWGGNYKGQIVISTEPLK